MGTKNIGIVICSRLKSKRLPGKAHLLLEGRTVISHLVNQLLRTNLPIVVAVPQDELMEYMNDHKDLVCSFIGKGLEMLNDPEKLAAANLSQITTAMGTLIDKWAMIGGSPADTVKEDALSQSLKEMAKELESDT